MRLPSLLAMTVFAVSLPLAATGPGAEKHPAAVPQTPSSDAFPNKSIVVYVADFDIGATDAPGTVRTAASRRVVAVNAASTAGAGATPGAAAAPANPAPAAGGSAADGATADGSATQPETQAPDGQKPDAQKPDVQKLDAGKSEDAGDGSPRVQAAKLVDLTSRTLVKMLQQAGYTARRLRNSTTLPDSGVVIRGVFAQVDANAGLRRVILGGAVTDPKMLLFVGVGNLARPEQSLYQVVGAQSVGALGPVISVSAYAPISRYELGRDPSEDELKATAEQISADVTRLLNANPLAVEQ